MTYYAHSDKNTDEAFWHRLKDHLQCVAVLSRDFAMKFGAGDFAYVAGLLHDIGKYSKEFQRRLHGEPLRVDHSTAGAKEAIKIFGDAIGKILAFIVAGHHSGLPDCGTKAGLDSALEVRLLKEDIRDYESYRNEISDLLPKAKFIPSINPISGHIGFSFSFFIRMTYSCLVDADFIDTERALNIEKAVLRGNTSAICEMKSKLDKSLDEKCANAPNTNINQMRANILKSCREKALEKPGLFSLTVPTGGGKTLSSLAFALKHAQLNGFDRVIYVIPFTSIIEQNAKVFKDILGANQVLEHHSNFQYPEEDSEQWAEAIEKLKLSSENWDIPLVVTTNVQFFESLFSSKSSKCRKIHNIANSVVILDEAQMLPTKFLKPCLAAISELVTNYHSTVVLCTATQPALGDLIPGGLKPVEIVESPKELYTAFKRVAVKHIGDCSDEDLAKLLSEHRQVLCILNTRRHAREIYIKLKDKEGVYHLSALMCPAHRSQMLGNIRNALKNGEACTVISTQLIEAGVDVDFPVVFRASAGIDSIVQAAGRCNREGRREIGYLYVFKPEKKGMPVGWFSRTASVTDMVLRQHEDLISIEAVEAYFKTLFGIEDKGLDGENILPSFEMDTKNLRFQFAEIAEKFKLIDNNTISVIIPWDDACKELIEEITFTPYPSSLARQFQPYTVQVYPFEFFELCKSKVIKVYAGMFNVLDDDSCYSEETGLMPQGDVNKLTDVLIL